MLTTLTVLAFVNCAALAGVLVLAQKDSLLVDDQHRPLDRQTAWQQAVVPATVTETPVSRI